MVEYLYGYVCHQLVNRSPQMDGHVFPLCYRCAGIHLGVFVSTGYFVISGGWRRDFPPLRASLLLALLLFPVWIDGWANGLGFWHTPGPLRYLTGLAMGFGLPLLLLPLCRFGAGPASISKESSLRVVLDLVGLFAMGLLFLLLLTQPYGVVVWPGMEYLALLGTVSLAAITGLTFRSVFQSWKTVPVESN